MPEKTALYRRYRPQRFAEVVGQDHVTRTLRNAIASGQVAHAYLLAGSRGTGKTTIARLIAKAVNCTKAKDGEPCDKCENCVGIRDGRFLDLIEIDAASNRGIDEMRDLREKVRFAPSQGQYKVYVIDEAHQLTKEAFDALLKTLEEPPPHAIFALATTEAQRIPATIVSRTQRFDLRRIPQKAMVELLTSICVQEKVQAEPAALEAIARHAQGSLRDAESILDQVATFASGKVTAAAVDELIGASDWEQTAALFDALAADDGARGVVLVSELIDDGRDLRLFVRRAIEHTRALVHTVATGTPPADLGEQVSAKLKAQAPRFTLDRLGRVAKRLVESEQQLRTSEGTPLSLELAILELTSNAKTEPSGPRTGEPRPAEPRAAAAAVAPKREPVPSPAPAKRPAGVVSIADRRATPTAPAAARADGGAASPTVALDAVHRAWLQLVGKMKERSMGTAALLAKAEPVAVEGGTVIVGFADEFARATWQDKRRAELERDLSEILTVTVRVRCVMQRTPADAAPATDDPMLRAALETFRRPERILEVE